MVALILLSRAGAGGFRSSSDLQGWLLPAGPNVAWQRKPQG
jgi:hypothetical protein